VIECVETEREGVVSVATPDELSVTVPSVVDPSMNVTVPPGVNVPGTAAATTAVNVTG